MICIDYHLNVWITLKYSILLLVLWVVNKLHFKMPKGLWWGHALWFQGIIGTDTKPREFLNTFSDISIVSSHNTNYHRIRPQHVIQKVI